MSEKKKKKPAAPPSGAIYEQDREKQIDELSKALLREYMHKRGFLRTLGAFDNEDPRTDMTIASRAVMLDLMHLGKKSKHSIMEDICHQRIGYRVFKAAAGPVEQSNAQLQAEIAEVEKKLEEALRSVASLEEEKAAEAREIAATAKAVKKADKLLKKKEAKAAAKAAGKGSKLGDSMNSTLQSASGLEESMVSEIGVGYRAKTDQSPLGFGGRNWAPPAVVSPGAASWSANALTSSMRSGLSEIREAMVKEVDVERQKHAVLHSSFFGHAGSPADEGSFNSSVGTPSTTSQQLVLKEAVRFSPAETPGKVSPATSNLKSSISDLKNLSMKQGKKVSFEIETQ
ncbi:hypothetical protein DIPPA_30796 [Diplonema papillatum]|nr:hypothetical protein DIPPA_30796 [Diplonema papillatum]